MAVFRFRMQNILDMKTKLEEQAKNDFAKAQKELADEEEALQALYDKKEAYLQEGVELRASAIHVQNILDNKKAIAHTDGVIEQQKVNVNVGGKKVDAATKKMMDARVQTKTYTKLREKAFENFLVEEAKKESKEIDELNSYRYKNR